MQTTAMPRRILFSVLIFLILFPLLLFLISFTPFFNDQVRTLLVSIVNNGTNATLYLGEIHGSIFGSFRIDGAALMYDSKPIALVDTVRISHFPLSLVTKTVDAGSVELVNPRFQLTRFKDGSMNVDHISKGPSAPGGKFDWTIVVKSVRLVNGQFSYYDSTARPKPEKVSMMAAKNSDPAFDPGNFIIANINMTADANITGENLTANIRKMALRLQPAGISVDSLSFGFFTSPGGTEVSGLTMKSGPTTIHADVTLMEQSLLDSIDTRLFRTREMSASLEARNVQLGDVEKFLVLPINPRARVSLSMFARGSLDTLNLRQLIVSTDSSRVPVTGTFYNLTDSTPSARMQSRGALVNPAELHSLLNDVNLPNFRALKPIALDADVVVGTGSVKVQTSLTSGNFTLSGNASLVGDSYDGAVSFRRLNLAELLDASAARSDLDGTASFSLRSKGRELPQGRINVELDSSNYDGTFIKSSIDNLVSEGDSVKLKVSVLSSNGNLNGDAFVNSKLKSYDARLAFSELNVAPFAHSPGLKSNLTGTLDLSGDGLSLDSSQTRIYLVTENSLFGNLQMDGAAFTLNLNTENQNKTFELRSPYVDADVSGSFVPLALPNQLVDVFTRLADSLSARVISRHDSTIQNAEVIPSLSATVDVTVKDARLISQFLDGGEVSGNPSVHFKIAYAPGNFSASGSVSADSILYSKDSTAISGASLGVRFDLKTGSDFSVWKNGRWSVDGNMEALRINSTDLSAKILRASYNSNDTSGSRRLDFSVLGKVDTLLDFYVDARASVADDSIAITTSSLLGKLYGISFTTHDPVHVAYTPETFKISPVTFWTELEGARRNDDSRVTLNGEYSLDHGVSLHAEFYDIGLAPLQRLARLDSTSLRVRGALNGTADINESPTGVAVSSLFTGTGVVYNGTLAKVVEGNFKVDSDNLTLAVQISKELDSTRDALKVDGVIPLNEQSRTGLELRFVADSLDISFLTPFLSGVENFGGLLSGDMSLSGSYSAPTFQGSMSVTDGRIRLSANEINYTFTGDLQGIGDRILITPAVLRNLATDGGESMTATGYLMIAHNTIDNLAIDLNGSLMVLNNSTQGAERGLSGVAVVGSGSRGLKLGGSLARLRLDGTLNIQNADLKLVGIQKSSGNYVQEIVYHFPPTPNPKSQSSHPQQNQNNMPPASTSSSVLDSLRYDLEIETRDNVILRMVFNPTTNEELYAILGGRMHLSNATGAMVLNGDVNVQSNSYYTFYKQFAATGKLSFTGDPLNPSLEINAQYQGEHADTSATKAPETVVVLLKITGTFNSPAVAISMTVDNNPYIGDPQTNAISFIVFGQFEDELTSTTRRSAADNLMSQAGAGMATIGTSVLSGALTNLLSREFKFIQSAGLRYSSVSNISDPDVYITGKIGPAIIRLGGQVFSDINNTDVSVDYPLTELLGNKLYLEASRKVSLNNRSYYQRETINMLKVFYQLSF